jgi:hypothetical protein
MHNCIGQSLSGSVGLRHPPDGRQQLGGQFCLADKIIHTSGHRRLPVGVAPFFLLFPIRHDVSLTVLALIAPTNEAYSTVPFNQSEHSKSVVHVVGQKHPMVTFP